MTATSTPYDEAAISRIAPSIYRAVSSCPRPCRRVGVVDYARSVNDTGTGKGKPTPKRREAEAQRRQRVKVPTDRKQAARLSRQRAADERAKIRRALTTGDESFLPARDRGPVRRQVRDIVDSRRSLAEISLFVLLPIVAVSFFRNPRVQLLSLIVLYGFIAGVAVDSALLIRRVRREVKARHADADLRGLGRYAILRSTQLRKTRRPPPRESRGHEGGGR
jgi:hypothetical protein